MSEIPATTRLERLHPPILQFVRDIDAIYVRLWNQFETKWRSYPSPLDTFPKSPFLDLFGKCHVELTNELLTVFPSDRRLYFPCALSAHSFMNGVEFKVSLRNKNCHRIIPYQSEEMQLVIATVVCEKWFRCEDPPFELEWERPPLWVRFYWRHSYVWKLTIHQHEKTMPFYKLMRYFFGTSFHHRHIDSSKNSFYKKVQWFLQKDQLDECLNLFSPLHARLPYLTLFPFLDEYLVPDLVRLCLSFL
jgi:hypothetical protein